MSSEAFMFSLKLFLMIIGSYLIGVATQNSYLGWGIFFCLFSLQN